MERVLDVYKRPISQVSCNVPFGQQMRLYTPRKSRYGPIEFTLSVSGYLSQLSERRANHDNKVQLERRIVPVEPGFISECRRIR